MSRTTRIHALTLLLGSAAFALGACQAIAGIEDRTYVADVAGDAGAAGADSGPPASPQCIEYCNSAKSVCTTIPDGATDPVPSLYLSDLACLATCAQMPPKGDNQNSVDCRNKQLGFMVDIGEPGQDYCPGAGPGGNGVCGSNCENYCYLFSIACKDEFQTYGEGDEGRAVCEKKCLGLTDTGSYNATQSGNYFGDTVQCRLVHTTSSMLDPGGHCSHAGLKSTEKCVDDPKAEPDCEKFCHLELTECSGFGFPMYDDPKQCLAVCGALDRGHIGDQAQNTVGCRMYHSYNSLLDPAMHCTHTGPGGDGHCVNSKDPDDGNCESYCRLLEAACESDFSDNFTDQAACQAECLKLDGHEANKGYSLSAKGDNLQCRLLHVSRAFAKPSECAAALGGSPCN
ncbi:MAG TPA: hypothetical protein VFK05_24155 [Polyangiaceae bacterium]|nr:hypothetical protein [Polyangiaceae bacterium]